MYNHVNWPHQYDPRRSAIYALNDVDVKAPPVWKLLVDAENWSSYFPAEDDVKILTGEPELALGTKYSRVTVGFLMNLIVTEYVPGRRLSWSTVVDGDETGSTILGLKEERIGHTCAEATSNTRHWASSDTTSSGTRIHNTLSHDACSSRPFSSLSPVFAASV
jgi:uncharacterized protein YndB with AHSA1/START domain